MIRELAPDAVLGERYKLVARRPFGSSGEAFLGEDLREGGRHVLLEHVQSLLPSAAAQSAIDRAVRVSRSIEGVAAPIVDVIDPAIGGASEGGWILVYDLPAGESLAALAEHRTLEDDAILKIGEALLAAVDRLHAAGQVHLGLTPRNVWIPSSDDGPILLVGVGLHHAATGESGALAHLGFWSYAAPEQLDPATRGAARGRADVYAAATILYKLWSGELPHRAKNALELIEARRKLPPRPLSETLGRPLPHALDLWFLSALAVDPAERPTSARALVELRAAARAVAEPPPAAPSEESVRLRQLDVLSELCERLGRGEPPLPTDVFLALLSELERRGDVEAVAHAWQDAGSPAAGRVFVPGASADTIASSELTAFAKADLDGLDPDDRKAVLEAVAQIMIDPVARGVEALGDPQNHLRVRAGAVRVLYVVRGGVLLVVRIRRGI